MTAKWFSPKFSGSMLLTPKQGWTLKPGISLKLLTLINKTNRLPQDDCQQQ